MLGRTLEPQARFMRTALTTATVGCGDRGRSRPRRAPPLGNRHQRIDIAVGRRHEFGGHPRVLRRTDSLAYPPCGHLGGESSLDPPRRDHHRVHPIPGGVIAHEVRQCAQLRVPARIANAIPTASTGTSGGVAEQVPPTFVEQFVGQRIRHRYPRLPVRRLRRPPRVGGEGWWGPGRLLPLPRLIQTANISCTEYQPHWASA